VIKTHSKSRFQLKTLEEIRDSAEIVLQIEKTDSSFIDSKKTAYLCEVVNPRDYRATPTLEQMAEELVKANNDNRALRRRIAKLETELRKAGARQ
jgi:predicted transcriptional regulator